MFIAKLCCIAVITAVCALVLRTHKSDLVPLCLTAGGIILILYSFDYLSETITLIKQFTELTKIDSSVIKIIFKVIGIGYLIELTCGAIKDLGFESLSDKLIICGKFVIFIMSVPILKAMFEIISSLINLV